MVKFLMNIEEVEKAYDKSGFRLGPISICIDWGTTIAILGKNGSGKTTFFKLITGNLDPTEGRITFCGKRLVPEKYQLKRKMGYLPQHHELPKWVTPREILSYAIRLYQLDRHDLRIEGSMDYWDCKFYADNPLAACSHGMQKRAALALATIHDPDLLVLDEPFSGLDIYHIKALTDVIENRRRAGKATIVCTHIAPYAACLCQSGYILESGKMKSIPEWSTLNNAERIESIEREFFPLSE